MEYRRYGIGRAQEVHYSVELNGVSKAVTAQASYLWISEIEAQLGRELNREEVEALTRGALRQYVQDHGEHPPHPWGITDESGYRERGQEFIELGKETPLGTEIEMKEEKEPLGFIKSR